MNTQTIVLASTSVYRKELLTRLGLNFATAAPDIDESPLPNESAKQTSLRLSAQKAYAVAKAFPNALIIGSDQVALLGELQIGKPGSHANAIRQLQLMRGKTITFYTAISLLNTNTNALESQVAENHVTFRHLSDAEIERYLIREQPYHCAGSAKSEGLGIALFSRMSGDDPNALIGLPLILLISMLKNQGVNVI